MPFSSASIPVRSPQQIATMNQLQGMGLQGLQGLGNLSFDPIEQRARTQFEQRTIPTILQRLGNMGGGLGSSSYRQALGMAGSDLEQGLAAQRAQYGLSQQGNLANLLQLGLQPHSENVIEQQAPSFGQNLLSILPQLLLAVGSGYFSGGSSAIPAVANAASSGWNSIRNLLSGSLGKASPSGRSVFDLSMQELPMSYTNAFRPGALGGGPSFGGWGKQPDLLSGGL